MVSIRRVEASEGQQLRTIRLASLQADPTAFGRTFEEESVYNAAYWDMRATGSSVSQTFVAVEGDVFIGMAGGYQPELSTPVELVSMWTAPSARGKGVGRGLVEAVVEWAADLAPSSVDLWVTRGNDPALALYESCGFTVTGDVTPSPADPCREEIRMRRPM